MFKVSDIEMFLKMIRALTPFSNDNFLYEICKFPSVNIILSACRVLILVDVVLSFPFAKYESIGRFSSL